MNRLKNLERIDIPHSHRYESIIVAITDPLEAPKMVNDTLFESRIGSHPLYAFFLYSDMDEDLAEFIRFKGYWLHCLSGNSCLVGMFENPKDWGEGWERHWQEKLGSLFGGIKAKWMELKPYDRNAAFFLAELLGIEKNTLPCIVFVESLPSNEILCIPIVADKSDYEEYLKDVFTAVTSAAKTPSGERIKALRSEWQRLWVKWILPRKAENMSKSIQKWGSIVKETGCAITGALGPFASLIQR